MTLSEFIVNYRKEHGLSQRRLSDQCGLSTGYIRHSGIVKEDGIPPILEKEVFYAMQRHLETKKNPRGKHRRDSADYLLTGKLYCGPCGSLMVGIAGTSHTGAMHYYYTCQNKRAGGDCKKKNAKKEDVELTVALMTQKFILRDDVIEWIADSAMEVLKDAGQEAEIEVMESELAENKKATKNIMNAIEQGIITASTKDRLLELESEAVTLEKSIAIAKAVMREKTIDRERLIFSMEQLRDGDVRSKEFQKRLIDTFVKAVYLWDDRIEIDYYYTGENSKITCTFNGVSGDSGASSARVRINSDEVHHKRVVRTSEGEIVTIILTAEAIVLLAPLNVSG